MRVLVCHRPGGAFGPISDGWINALRDAGVVAERWDATQRTWDNFDPDLYLGCSGHRQPVPPPAGRRAKIAIHVNPYGKRPAPGIDETQDAINWVFRQKPNAVFGYGFAEHADFWSKWADHGVPWCPMPTAGDVTIYKLLAGYNREVGIGYVGGRWQYKATRLDPYLSPLIVAKQIKIHGWGDWPVICGNTGVFGGQLQDGDVPIFLNRCRVAPCVCEPHTVQYGIDLPERVFKVALCGALPVHDCDPHLSQQLKFLIIGANPVDYRRLCLEWSAPLNEEKRKRTAGAVRAEVLGGHTYHHRLAGLFQTLGFTDVATDLLAAVKRHV